MKYRILAVLAFFAITVSSISFAQQKVAVVDVRSVLQNAPQRDGIGEKLRSEFKSKFDEVQKIQEEGRALSERLQRDAAVLSTSEKTELERQIDRKAADLQLKDKEVKEDLKRRQDEETRKLLIDIQAAIRRVAEKDKYDLIINREAILFANSATDITPVVLEMISSPAN